MPLASVLAMVRVRACGLVAVFLERELLQVLFAPLHWFAGSFVDPETGRSKRHSRGDPTVPLGIG